MIGSANNRLELWLQNDNLIARKYHDNKLQTELSESAAIHLHGYNVMGVTYTISGRLRIYADGYQIGQKYGPVLAAGQQPSGRAVLWDRRRSQNS